MISKKESTQWVLLVSITTRLDNCLHTRTLEAFLLDISVNRYTPRRAKCLKFSRPTERGCRARRPACCTLLLPD